MHSRVAAYVCLQTLKSRPYPGTLTTQSSADCTDRLRFSADRAELILAGCHPQFPFFTACTPGSCVICRLHRQQPVSADRAELTHAVDPAAILVNLSGGGSEGAADAEVWRSDADIQAETRQRCRKVPTCDDDPQKWWNAHYVWPYPTVRSDIRSGEPWQGWLSVHTVVYSALCSVYTVCNTECVSGQQHASSLLQSSCLKDLSALHQNL
jgi:hypothetical protein